MHARMFIPMNSTITIESVQDLPIMVADAVYPLHRWLMTPYPRALISDESTFNSTNGNLQGVVEHTFRWLKVRQWCLVTKLPQARGESLSVIASCIILHNVCKEWGHQMLFLEGLPEPAQLPGMGSQQSRMQGTRKWAGRYRQHSVSDLCDGETAERAQWRGERGGAVLHGRGPMHMVGPRGWWGPAI